MRAINHQTRAGLVLGAALLFANVASAFPPAPHHTLYGMVRNQWGEPLNVVGAEVFLLTGTNPGVRVQIAASTNPGENYRLLVPMDSGTTIDLYQPNALTASATFQLKVTIGDVTYLPLEMARAPRLIGQAADATRLDLTLGVDSDGDGLPDAWEQAIIAVLGGTLASITPDGDADGDGISNRDEYLAGTLPFDPNDGFRLTLTGLTPDKAKIQFFAVRGRSYRIESSTDLRQWTPVSFRISGDSSGLLQTGYAAPNYQLLQIEVPGVAGGETNRYFRALVQ